CLAVLTRPMPFLRNLSALLILSLALAGCVAERPSGPEMSQLAPAAATAYRITAAAAGPLTGGVAFSRSRLQELFPGREIQTIGLANEDRTFYGFVVFDQGL